MSKADDVLQHVHVLLEEALLDALYRVERLEELNVLSSRDSNATPWSRLPSLSTGEAQDKAIRLLESRLTRLERQYGE